MMRNSQRFAAIHIAKSLGKAIARPKLVKEYACPNPQAEMKIVANLKDKYMEMNESQPLTKAIRNLGKVLILKLIVLIKISSKLKVRYFKMPNYV